jgi:hypothetical protein
MVDSLSRHVTQIVDIGIEQPTRVATHAHPRVAERPTLYVDSTDLSATNLMMVPGSPHTRYVRAWPHELPVIVDGAGRAGFDPGKPVGVILHAVLEFYGFAAAGRLLQEMSHRFAPGSMLAFTHATPRVYETCDDWTLPGAPPINARQSSVIDAMIRDAGLVPVGRGVVEARHWTPGGQNVPDHNPDASPLVAGWAQLAATAPR